MDKNLCLNIVKIGSAFTVAVVSVGFISCAIRKVVGKKTQDEKFKPKRWIRVGSVSKLTIYPVKSCQGIELPEVEATPIGLKGLNSDALRDRIFMVVDYRYGFQTQRNLPRLALIKVEVKGDEVTLNGPGMHDLTISVPENILKNKRSCRVWDDHVREVLDCGDEVGKWLDTFFEGTGYRLVYHSLAKTQRKRTPIQEQFPMFFAQDKGAFQDQTSYMLMAEESIVNLNGMLKNKVTHRNFRPSILIHGIPEPFAEDFWGYVRIGSEGGPILKTAKPCTRCRLTTVNPDTAEFDPEGQPLQTLVDMKRNFGDSVVDKLVDEMGVIGIQLGLYQAGNPIRVGDAVYVALL